MEHGYTGLKYHLKTFFANLEHPVRFMIIIGAIALLLCGSIIGAIVKSQHHTKAQLTASNLALGNNPTNNGTVDYGNQLSDGSSNDGDGSSSSSDGDSYDESGDVNVGDDVYDSDDDNSAAADSDDVDETYDEVNDVIYNLDSNVPAPTPTESGAISNPGAQSTKVTKLLIFIEENHSLDQMKAGMPYAFALAKKYGYASNYYGITHPSLPNYISIAGGDSYGIRDDSSPSAHNVTGTSIFGQAIKAGKSAVLYADGMPGNCSQGDGGSQYHVKHNPWAYFRSERSLCNKYDIPGSNLVLAARGGRLPNVGMVIPNICHDAHDCSLSVADNWFKSQMVEVFKGSDWKSGHLAVVLTADEDDNHSGNKVLTVVMHPSLNGRVSNTRLNHYSLSRLAAQVSHSSTIKNATSAPSMSAAFGLPL